MQPVSSRIWTRVAVSISYDDNHYTTATSIVYVYNTKDNDNSSNILNNINYQASFKRFWQTL